MRSLIRIFFPSSPVNPIQLSTMAHTSRHSYHVEVVRSSGLGSNWIVRVYKKFLFWKKRISSDWFLDSAQAERFAQRLREDLLQKDTVQKLRERRPGWTLHRPAR